MAPNYSVALLHANRGMIGLPHDLQPFSVFFCNLAARGVGSVSINAFGKWTRIAQPAVRISENTRHQSTRVTRCGYTRFHVTEASASTIGLQS
jgi:hypothetical protein